MDFLAEALKYAGPLSLPVGLGAIVGAILSFISAKKMLSRREELRRLRIALESDPSTDDIRRAKQMWPEALKFPENQQVSHMKGLAAKAETRAADSAERVMTLTRLICALAVLMAIIFTLSQFIKPPGAA